MDRRNFLKTSVVGVGALMVAGKFPPSRPSFVLEMKEGRSSYLWLNGKKPDTSWSYEGDEFEMNSQNLSVDGMKITNIKIDRQPCGEMLPPKGTEVTMVTSKGTFKGKITYTATARWDVVGDVQPVKVKLHSGEEIEIDEVHVFFRVEFTN